MAVAIIEPGLLRSAYRSDWSSKALLRRESYAFSTAAEPTPTAAARNLGTTGFPSRTGYPHFSDPIGSAINATLITFRSHAQLFDNLYRVCSLRNPYRRYRTEKEQAARRIVGFHLCSSVGARTAVHDSPTPGRQTSVRRPQGWCGGPISARFIVQHMSIRQRIGSNLDVHGPRH